MGGEGWEREETQEDYLENPFKITLNYSVLFTIK